MERGLKVYDIAGVCVWLCQHQIPRSYPLYFAEYKCSVYKDSQDLFEFDIMKKVSFFGSLGCISL